MKEFVLVVSGDERRKSIGAWLLGDAPEAVVVGACKLVDLQSWVRSHAGVDVVLLDEESVYPFERLRWVADYIPRCWSGAWIFVFGRGELAAIVAAARARVHGYVLCRPSTGELMAAVARARRGDFALTPCLSVAVNGAASARARQTPNARNAAGLTTREAQVATLMSRGASDAEISRDLGITLATAKWYTRNVRSKTGIHRRARLAAMWSDRLIDGEREGP